MSLSLSLWALICSVKIWTCSWRASLSDWSRRTRSDELSCRCWKRRRKFHLNSQKFKSFLRSIECSNLVALIIMIATTRRRWIRHVRVWITRPRQRQIRRMVKQFLATSKPVRIVRSSIIFHRPQIFPTRHVMLVIVMIPWRKRRWRRNFPGYWRHSSIAARTRRIVFRKFIGNQKFFVQIFLAQRMRASTFRVTFASIWLTSTALTTIETSRGIRSRRFSHRRWFWIFRLPFRRFRRIFRAMLYGEVFVRSFLWSL